MLPAFGATTANDAHEAREDAYHYADQRSRELLLLPSLLRVLFGGGRLLPFPRTTTSGRLLGCIVEWGQEARWHE